MHKEAAQAARMKLGNLGMLIRQIRNRAAAAEATIFDLTTLLEEIAVENNGDHPPDHESTLHTPTDEAIARGDLDPSC